MGNPEVLSAPDAARRRFHRLQWLLMLLFAGCMWIAAALVEGTQHPGARVAAASVPASVLVVWATAFARMIRGEDEMMQTVQLRAVSIGSGLVLFAVSLWGLFEGMLGAPHFPSFLLLPAFAMAYSAVLFIQGRSEP